jgi:hypothetical protein
MFASGDASGVSGSPDFPARLWVSAFAFLTPPFAAAFVSLPVLLFFCFSFGLQRR